MNAYNEGRAMQLCGVAGRIKGMHELEGLISDEARTRIFDFLRKEAMTIDDDALEGINRIDGRVKA